MYAVDDSKDRNVPEKMALVRHAKCLRAASTLDIERTAEVIARQIRIDMMVILCH